MPDRAAQPDQAPASTELEITPEMIDAGVKELWDSGWFEIASLSDRILVARVFSAMVSVRRAS